MLFNVKRRRPVRTAILLLSLCVGAWQAPALYEQIDAHISGLKNPAAAAEFQLPEGSLGIDPANPEGGMLIISPAGVELDASDRERLIAQAESLAPKAEPKSKKNRRPRR